ncbi:MAG: TonB-dependent receptor [Bacteroidales bacterium]|nr:TonB-dependent receptor [Bacteroidales bacterium]
MKRIGLFIVNLLLITLTLHAQHPISGILQEAETGLPIGNVQITSPGSAIGTTSNADGSFLLITDKNNIQLAFHHLSYKTLSRYVVLHSQEMDLGIIQLEKLPVNLDEINITGGMVTESSSPITISTITGKEIQTQLGDQPLPLLMNSIPGIYSTRTGGGSGDAELSIRGFNQENIGILLNGIPISSVENGLVYWNNWLGLSHAIAEIQVQKGPGVSNAAINSVGGSLNIVTSNPKEIPDFSLSYRVTSFGNQEISFSANSGIMENGWNVAFYGSYLHGDGYIDATNVSAWSYFLTLNKQFNAKNKLTITLLGTPEIHGQRTLKLSDQEHRYYGNLYNKDWGGLNGKVKNASENFYHKPVLSANHNYTLNSKTILATAVYFTPGYGGGNWSESFQYAPSVFEFRNESGQIDWPAIYNNNATNQGSSVLENGDTISGYSINVGTQYLASHIQTGLMSTLRHAINDQLTLTGGIHYRYFNSFVREQITDLMGGKVFIDDYSWAVDGVSGRDQLNYVGDIIKVNNSSIVNFTSAYLQAIYNSGRINAYVSLGGNNNWYQRVDRYNYVKNQKSETIVKPGFDLRGGTCYNFGTRHEIFANAAIISRAPYFKYVFGNYTNVPVHDLKNEQISTVEAGYRFHNRSIKFEANAYYTDWGNVSMLSNEYIQLENNTQSRAMVNGLHAIHQGVESVLDVQINKNMGMGLIASFGNYSWQNDITATLLNSDNVVVDTIMVMAKGLKVGGTAQQQLGAQLNFKALKIIDLKLEWMYYDQLYASFDPVNRTNPHDRMQPYQIPAFHIINIYAGIHTKVLNTPCLLQLNAYNLLNTIHVVYAQDGSGHDLATMTGFWSFGRTFDITLKFSL